jgi:hypothetical protein
VIALPWNEKQNPKKMLEDEIVRQLQIMKDNKPESDAYKQAMIRYENLHEHGLKEDKLKENRRARWFEALVTGALAGLTLTAEQWTPLTSKWYNSLMHPFRSRRDID